MVFETPRPEAQMESSLFFDTSQVGVAGCRSSFLERSPTGDALVSYS